MAKGSELSVKESKIQMDTLLALASNDTITDAAASLGVSRETVYQRIHKFGLTEKLKDIHQAATVELITGAGKAARNLISKIDSENQDISLKASVETLDRVGLTKSDKSDGKANTINNFGQMLVQQKGKYDD